MLYLKIHPLLEIWSQPNVTELRCMWNKYANIETMKLISSSVIYLTISKNGSYSLLFVKKQWQSLQISCK